MEDEEDDILELRGEIFDMLIKKELHEYKSKTGKHPRFLVLNTNGSFLLKSFLGLDDVIELPKSYRKMEVLFSPKQDAETIRLI